VKLALAADGYIGDSVHVCRGWTHTKPDRRRDTGTIRVVDGFSRSWGRPFDTSLFQKDRRERLLV
jgi:hypothetical protein